MFAYMVSRIVSSMIDGELLGENMGQDITYLVGRKRFLDGIQVTLLYIWSLQGSVLEKCW